jgi:hypothetical protein
MAIHSSTEGKRSSMKCPHLTILFCMTVAAAAAQSPAAGPAFVSPVSFLRRLLGRRCQCSRLCRSAREETATILARSHLKVSSVFQLG